MEEKYDPARLMMNVAMLVKSVGAMVFSVDQEDLKKIQIHIALKNPNLAPFLIIKDPERSDATILLLQGTRVKKSNSLVTAKDDLAAVTIYYEGKIYRSFASYEDFWQSVKRN